MDFLINVKNIVKFKWLNRISVWDLLFLLIEPILQRLKSLFSFVRAIEESIFSDHIRLTYQKDYFIQQFFSSHATHLHASWQRLFTATHCPPRCNHLHQNLQWEWVFIFENFNWSGGDSWVELHFLLSIYILFRGDFPMRLSLFPQFTRISPFLYLGT